jgi:putative heme-binding domain-containing protein
MQGSTPRRLLVLASLTALLTVAAFELEFHLRVQEELSKPSHYATPVESLRVLPGFKVRLLHAAAPDEGSWICMTREPQGRLIIAPEEGKLLRVTLTGRNVAKIERLDQPVKQCMGLLYASNSLYLDGDGPKGWGVYREKDNGGVLAAPEMLLPLNCTVTEHGPHGLVLGPDHKLYIVCGNFTALPPGLAEDSPLRNYAEDQLLPPDLDPRGQEANLKPPGGFIVRMDLDGKNGQLWAGGLRNIYALAFNADGEMFGAENDNDEEWGLAWYRPVHLNHCVSGGDYGFREGTGKLPYYDQETLPPLRDLGLGAPSGVKFAPANARFPASYSNVCFVEDWTYGRLFAVHCLPHGATYDATVETVLRGKPLNLSALEFGLDGDLYFITGGRYAGSGLYSLIYEGSQMEEQPETKANQLKDQAASAARDLRRQLESFQGRRDPRALDVIWPGLSSPDRWIRYAARVALEFQDAAWWKDRALAETNLDGDLTALLALARCGGRETQAGLLQALDKFPFSRLTHEQELLKMRVMELSFIRQGRPSDALASRAIEMLDSLYPATDEDVNQELCELLLYLQAPDAVAKTVALLGKALTQEEQTYYVMRLRTITNGWTLDLRREYLGWFQKKRDHVRHRPDIVQSFHELDMDYTDGSYFDLYLDTFLHEATASLGAGETQALAAYLPKPPAPTPVARGSKFIKQWRMADLEPHLARLQEPRSRARGRAIFTENQCALCHHFANTGGAVGPDLTAVGSRLTARGLLESILEPSKVLPEQYQNIVLTTRDGDVLTGRMVEENGQRLVLMTDLIRRTTVEIPQAEIVSRRASKISPMPEGLVNSLTEDEIWDLIAYLQSASRPAQPAPRK